ncbi:TPA: hypothetical protein DEP21_05880 [Patescibacteria group bacterium]|nr:hypothetical protein [Candidatus Gracilibacteria bacterium]
MTTKSDTSKTTSFDDLGSSKVPTSMILTVMKELMKTYDNLYPGVFLSRIRDNIQAASRWYKVNGSGELIDNMDSHLQKLVIKDTLSIGDITN